MALRDGGFGVSGGGRVFSRGAVPRGGPRAVPPRAAAVGSRYSRAVPAGTPGAVPWRGTSFVRTTPRAFPSGAPVRAPASPGAAVSRVSGFAQSAWSQLLALGARAQGFGAQLWGAIASSVLLQRGTGGGPADTAEGWSQQFETSGAQDRALVVSWYLGARYAWVRQGWGEARAADTGAPGSWSGTAARIQAQTFGDPDYRIPGVRIIGSLANGTEFLILQEGPTMGKAGGELSRPGETPARIFGITGISVDGVAQPLPGADDVTGGVARQIETTAATASLPRLVGAGPSANAGALARPAAPGFLPDPLTTTPADPTIRRPVEVERGGSVREQLARQLGQMAGVANGIRTGPDGQLVRAPGAGPLQTPANRRTYGPVTIEAPPVAPTIKAIAQEVGNIEQKLGKLLNPGPQDAPDWLGELQKLIDSLKEVNDSGRYTLSSPCQTGPDGAPVVRTREWGGKADSLSNIASRIDALALLLQDHKDLRQPICKGAPRSNVTITAYEVFPEE